MSAPRRVLRVIGRLNIGGPARHAILLTQYLRAHGYETRLVHGACAPGEASLQEYADGRSIESVALPMLGRSLRPWDDLRALVEIYRLACRDRPAVVHTHTSKAGGVGRLAAWLYNLTVGRKSPALIVHTFHGHVFRGYFSRVVTRLIRMSERLLAMLSDRVVALSPLQADELVNLYRIAPASKVVVVPLGLELDELFALEADGRRLRRELGFGDDDFVFGYVGRLVTIKDLPTLFRAFSLVIRLHPRARLAIVGDGQRRADWEELARTLNLDEYVRFAGWRRRLPDVYAALDAVVISSINEGTPVALIEAMAAGRPVVATRVGGIPDMIEDGRTGWLVPSGDPESLSRAMVLATELTAEGRAAVGARARVSARRFTADRLAGDVAELYRRSTSPASSVAVDHNLGYPPGRW